MTIAQNVAGAAQTAALGSLGEIAQSPLARAAVRYWWVSVPLAYAGWRSWQQRKAKGQQPHPIDIVMDVAPLVTLVAGLVMLNQCLAANQPAAAPIRPAKPAGPAPRDADFTVRTGAPAAPALET